MDTDSERIRKLKEEREVLTLSLERTLNGCQHTDCRDMDRKLMEHMKAKIAREKS